METILKYFFEAMGFLLFVYCFFFVARAGWSREWDKWNKVLVVSETDVKKIINEPKKH